MRILIQDAHTRMGQHFVPHEYYVAIPSMISYVAIFCHFMQSLAGLPASTAGSSIAHTYSKGATFNG